jgi:hypothetical protein
MKSYVRAALLTCAIVVIGRSPATAQFVVNDAATTAQNRITAGLNELLYRLQQQHHDKILEMARRLSALTDLKKYVTVDVPRWRTHGGDDVLFASPYLRSLIFGDPTGVAYTELAQVPVTSARLDQLPARARRAVMSRVAGIELADATAIAGIHNTGQLRLNGRKKELPAIDALETDVIDPSSDQSTTAVLEKISGAALVGARQRQARIQLLTSVLEQLLADGKRDRDTDAAALNMQLVTWRDRRAADAAFAAGSGEALRTWRQP